MIAFGANLPNENNTIITNGIINSYNFKFNIRFMGQYWDEEKGTSYNYFRDYANGLGRYIQSDPIGLNAGINTYGYVNSNPFSNIDLYGLDIYTCKGVAENVYHKWIIITNGVNETAIGWNPNTDNQIKLLNSQGKWNIETPSKHRLQQFKNNCELIKSTPKMEKCLINLPTNNIVPNVHSYSLINLWGDNCFSAAEKAIHHCGALK